MPFPLLLERALLGVFATKHSNSLQGDAKIDEATTHIHEDQKDAGFAVIRRLPVAQLRRYTIQWKDTDKRVESSRDNISDESTPCSVEDKGVLKFEHRDSDPSKISKLLPLMLPPMDCDIEALSEAEPTSSSEDSRTFKRELLHFEDWSRKILGTTNSNATESLIAHLSANLLDTFETAVCCSINESTRVFGALMRSMEAELGHDSPLRGLPPEFSSAINRAATDDPHGEKVLLRAVLWRLIFAQFIVKRLAVREKETTLARLEYANAIFGDTHHDLLLTMYRYGRHDDSFFLMKEGGRAMTLVYPLPHRIVCAEELPDMTQLLSYTAVPMESKRRRNPNNSRSRRKNVKHGAKTAEDGVQAQDNSIELSETDDQMREQGGGGGGGGANDKDEDLAVNSDPTGQRIRVAMAHLFVRKQLNQICHVRHLCDTVRVYTQHHREIALLMPLVLRVSLLGNFPNCTNRGSFASRLRIAHDLSEDPLGGIEWNLSQRVDTFVSKHRHTALFLMREHLVYTTEADGVRFIHAYDQPRRFHWLAFKAIVRSANAELRQEFSRQICKDFGAEINWNTIEPASIAGELVNAKLRRGAIMFRAHARALEHREKVLKGPAEALIAKKMISVHAKVLEFHADEAIASSSVLSEEASNYTTLTLRERSRKLTELRRRVLKTNVLPTLLPHLEKALPLVRRIAEDSASRICGASRMQSSSVKTDGNLSSNYENHETLKSVAPVDGLLLLGIDRDSYQDIRQWIYRYYVHEQPDNSYKKLALAFGKRSLFSHIVIMAYFRELAAARTDGRHFILPVNATARVLWRLRERSGLMPLDETLKELAVSYICESCDYWATPLQVSPPWIETPHGMIESEADLEAVQAMDVLAETRILANAAAGLCSQMRGARESRNKNAVQVAARRRRKIEKNSPRASEKPSNFMNLGLKSGQTHRDRSWDDLPQASNGMLGIYIRPIRAIGDMRHVINPQNGEKYCKRYHVPKQNLIDHSSLARKSMEKHLRELKTPPVSAEESRTMKRKLSSGRENQENNVKATKRLKSAETTSNESSELQCVNPAIEDGRKESWLEDPGEFGEPNGKQELPFIHLLSGDDTIRTENEDPTGDSEVASASSKNLLVEELDLLFERYKLGTRTIKNAAVQTCASEPLLAVDLSKSWVSIAGYLVGLCVYCGNATTVSSNKMTNYGLSCMNHAHAEFPYDSPQALAFAGRISESGSRLAGRRSISVDNVPVYHDVFPMMLTRHPHTLDDAVSCAHCRKYYTRLVVRVLVEYYRVVELPLCHVCLDQARNYMPTSVLGVSGAIAVEPIPIEMLHHHLQKSLNRNNIARSAEDGCVEKVKLSASSQNVNDKKDDLDSDDEFDVSLDLCDAEEFAASAKTFSEQDDIISGDASHFPTGADECLAAISRHRNFSKLEKISPELYTEFIFATFSSQSSASTCQGPASRSPVINPGAENVPGNNYQKISVEKLYEILHVLDRSD